MSKFKKLIILMSIFLFVFAYNICYAVDLNLVDNTDTSSDLTADNSSADDSSTTNNDISNSINTTNTTNTAKADCRKTEYVCTAAAGIMNKRDGLRKK